MALNAYARTITNRIADPVAGVLARLGFSANGLTLAGLCVVVAGVGLVVTGHPRTGAAVVAVGSIVDAFDGALARRLGTDGKLGAFADSVTDRVGDIALFGAAAWLVRDDPVTFAVAVVAFGGAQLTSYVRARAESLGWDATVGIIERAERVIVLIFAFFFGFVGLAVWVLAAGSLVTIGQRLAAVTRQAGETPERGQRT